MATRRHKSYSSVVAAALVVLLSVGQAYSDDISTTTTTTKNGSSSSAQQPSPARLPRQLVDASDVRSADVIATSDNETRPFHNSSIPDLSLYSKTELYSILIEVLQQLDVLDKNEGACQKLTEISSPERNSRTSAGNKVRISLDFMETPLNTKDHSSTRTKDGNSNSQSSRTRADSVMCVSSPKIPGSLDAQPLLRNDVNSSHDSGGAGTGRHTADNDGGYEETDEEGSSERDRFGGLSRTQVVVISTCSAIIALFFLVAGILRIRNYIKRVREEQMMAQRPTFRSCSVRLRSVSQSNDPVRRDSQVSKLSHQSNYNGRNQGYSLTNGSTSRDHSNASSPNHDPDTKPLLVVTAVTEGRSPSVSQSSSLQFIDEEPRKKTERAPAGPEGGDEYRPLLGSDTSASSLMVSPTSPTANGLCVGHQNGHHNGHSPNGHLNGHFSGKSLGVRHQGHHTGEDGAETYFQRVSDTPSPKNDRAGVLETSFDDHQRRRVPEQYQQQHYQQQHQQQTKQSPPAGKEKRVKLPAEQVNQIPKTNGIAEVPLIRFCGLTQSDTSLSSTDGNRNYGYGTQTEYTPPYLGYFAGGEFINGLNSPYAFTFITNPSGMYRVASNPQSIATKDRPVSYDVSRQNGRMRKHDLASDSATPQSPNQRTPAASFGSGVEVPLSLPLRSHSSETDSASDPASHRGHVSADSERQRADARGTPNTPPSLVSSPTHWYHEQNQKRPLKTRDSFSLSSATPFQQESFDELQDTCDPDPAETHPKARVSGQDSFSIFSPSPYRHKTPYFDGQGSFGQGQVETPSQEEQTPRSLQSPSSFSVFSSEPSQHHTTSLDEQRQDSLDQSQSQVQTQSTGGQSPQETTPSAHANIQASDNQTQGSCEQDSLRSVEGETSEHSNHEVSDRLPSACAAGTTDLPGTNGGQSQPDSEHKTEPGLSPEQGSVLKSSCASNTDIKTYSETGSCTEFPKSDPSHVGTEQEDNSETDRVSTTETVTSSSECQAEGSSVPNISQGTSAPSAVGDNSFTTDSVAPSASGTPCDSSDARATGSSDSSNSQLLQTEVATRAADTTDSDKQNASSASRDGGRSRSDSSCSGSAVPADSGVLKAILSVDDERTTFL